MWRTVARNQRDGADLDAGDVGDGVAGAGRACKGQTKVAAAKSAWHGPLILAQARDGPVHLPWARGYSVNA